MRWGRRWLVPEVIQTSAMDCGPATLSSLLSGYGITVDYGQLRDWCQTDVDGTSIDTIEELATRLGLEAEQVMLPVDLVLRPESRALPALAVVRQADGSPHFVAVWRRHGGVVQIMDPGRGRVWVPVDRFLDMLHVHAQPVSAADWREWAGSDESLAPLRRRMKAHGLSRRVTARLLAAACRDPTWRTLAALDAALRWLDVLSQAAVPVRASRAAALLQQWTEAAADPSEGEPQDEIPRECWSVWPAGADDEGEETLTLLGAVLVKLAGRSVARPQTESSGEEDTDPDQVVAAAASASIAGRTPLAGPGRDSWAGLFRLARADGLLAPVALLFAAAVAALGVVGEAVLFRASFDLVADLGVVEQRLGATLAVLVFLAVLLAIEYPLQVGWLRLGRRFELRVRDGILARIPRLEDRYFRSRLASDLAERAHAVHLLRQFPALGGQALRACFGLVFTVLGVVWLDPASAVVAVPLGVLAVALPLLATPILSARDMAFRTHAGALAAYHLDALRGLISLRTHGAEPAMRASHGQRLRAWQSAGLQFTRAAVWVTGIQSLLGFAGAAVVLHGHLSRGAEIGAVLLLVYWVLSIPVLAERFAAVLQQMPQQRNVASRVLEMLTAHVPDSALKGVAEGDARSLATTDAPACGVDVVLDDVSIEVQGHSILEGVNCRFAPGEHVAVVGTSGAGKSSLLALLLGFHRPSHGAIRVDGQPLVESRLRNLRSHTAWVDPAVTLWNRSLADNLRYGTVAGAVDLSHVVRNADLRSVLQRLPQGLQTCLGEEGGLVSGGEGQRVRLGRALSRPAVRLVVLDEPFRGLDRASRQRLLRLARQEWRTATLLCVTHDIRETRNFDRVLVVDGGRIVEDGSPSDLVARGDSRYGRLLEIEETVGRSVWSATRWRRLWMENGTLTAEGPQS